MPLSAHRRLWAILWTTIVIVLIHGSVASASSEIHASSYLLQPEEELSFLVDKSQSLDQRQLSNEKLNYPVLSLEPHRPGS